MKKKKNLYAELLLITILPILLIGITITILCVCRFSNIIYKQIQKELADIAISVLNTYDMMYPGDYIVEEKNGHMELYKGGELLTGNYEYLDSLKKDTDIDITIFYYNTRVLTTVFNDGKRIVGTDVNDVVEKEVLENKQENFYKSVYIEQEKFFAYYKPIFSSDGECIGMIFTGKPIKEVKEEIYNNIQPVFLIAVISICILTLVYFYYTKTIVRIIKKLQEFMGDISKGELCSELDDSILKRSDEIGLIGKSAVEMQKALKVFVDQDVLTKINNRRSGEKLLNKTIAESKNKGTNFALAIGDIDWFKKVNDNFGHECGDYVLQSVAAILKKYIEGKGYVARWGGEEFLLVFYDSTLETAYILLKSIADEIRSTNIIYEDKQISITMTFGITEGNGNVKEYKIIKEADKKLYLGKNAGRDRIVK